MVRPLTKRRENGDLYTRLKVIEGELDRVAEIEPDVLIQRAKITRRQEPDYLSSECLVYLIREAIRTGSRSKIDFLLPRLLSRCDAILQVKVADYEFPDAESVREEILGDFSVVLASDGHGENPDVLDFYEIHFNQAFRAFRLDRLRSVRRRTREIVPVPEPSMEDEEENYEAVLTRLSRTMRVPAGQEAAVFEHELWKAIKSLPHEEFSAFLLTHVLDYKIESENPHQITAASLCNCSGRTIRNRLARAAAKLKPLREEL